MGDFESHKAISQVLNNIDKTPLRTGNHSLILSLHFIFSIWGVQVVTSQHIGLMVSLVTKNARGTIEMSRINVFHLIRLVQLWNLLHFLVLRKQSKFYSTIFLKIIEQLLQRKRETQNRDSSIQIQYWRGFLMSWILFPYQWK